MQDLSLAETAAAALVSGCAKGKHFDTVVLTANGKRQQLSNATFTCTHLHGTESGPRRQD